MSAGRLVIRALRALRQRLAPQPVIRLVRNEGARVLDNSLLRERNVLVTGAGRNIGRSIAVEMARQGGAIYFTDVDAHAVERLTTDLETMGARGRGFVSNIASPGDVAALCELLDREGIVVDVLANNVGITSRGGIRTMNMVDLRTVFETNVFGPIELTQAIVKRLIAAERPGSILFVTSVHQWSTFGDLAYAASKAALGMVVKELAHELAAHRIRVNGIAPGAVAATEHDELTPFAASVLGGTSIHPSYIGRAAVYLAAEYFSEFTTGTVLTVDAGLLSRPQNR